MTEPEEIKLCSVFSLPRATAPADTKTLWLDAYAFCRGMNRVACACEYNVVEPCPHLLLGDVEAEKQRETRA